jgi:hypothetical protein
MTWKERGTSPAPLPPPPKPRVDVPAPGDHRAWAAWWGDQAVAAVGRAQLSGEFTDLDVKHAVRAARLAWYHACTVKQYRYWDESWTAKLLVAKS